MPEKHDGPDDRDRKASILRRVPEIFDAQAICLYVGAHEGRIDFGPELVDAGWTLDILEAWEPNCAALHGLGLPWLRRLLHGDVRDPRGAVGYAGSDALRDSYDLVFWWHGPEHIACSELASCLSALEAITPGGLVVLGCPWGDYPQDDAYGNPFERHLWAPEPEDFTALGYDVESLPPRGVGGNLLCWKRAAP